MNMMFSLTGIAALEMTLAERAAYAGRMMLVGMLMVFAVLTLLWGVLAISKTVFYDMAKKRAEQASAASDVAAASMTVSSSAPVSNVSPLSAAPSTASDDGAIIAAITAAIAAARAEEGNGGAFRVVSFRRAQDTRAWNRK